jgi:hypothetical protein
LLGLSSIQPGHCTLDVHAFVTTSTSPLKGDVKRPKMLTGWSYRGCSGGVILVILSDCCDGFCPNQNLPWMVLSQRSLLYENIFSSSWCFWVLLIDWRLVNM